MAKQDFNKMIPAKFQGLKTASLSGALSIQVDGKAIALEADVGNDNPFLEFRDGQGQTIILAVDNTEIGQVIDLKDAEKAFVYWGHNNEGWVANKGYIKVEKAEKEGGYYGIFQATHTDENKILEFGSFNVAFD